VIVGELNTPPSQIDWSSKQKINKESLELNHSIDQMELAEDCRIFHPTATQYTFFSAAKKSLTSQSTKQASANIRK
jgi:exonuclease III